MNSPSKPQYQQHVNIAHSLWKDCVSKDDVAIDATCGNGHDTLFLAPLVKHLYAMDIQKSAIDNTEALTQQFQNISFILGSHEKFPLEIKKESIKLIVYNLGYLPGQDKTLTTMTATTIESLQHALELLVKGGLISITCYPGHAEGKIEQEALLQFVSKLNSKQWSVSWMHYLNRSNAPSLLFIYKLF